MSTKNTFWLNGLDSSQAQMGVIKKVTKLADICNHKTIQTFAACRPTTDISIQFKKKSDDHQICLTTHINQEGQHSKQSMSQT